MITQAVLDLAGDDSLDFLARVPYGYYEAHRIEEDLVRAGFATVSMERVGEHR